METAAIIFLAALAAFFAWRYHRVLRGAAELNAAIRREAPPALRDLPIAGESARLSRLARGTLDALTEARMERDSVNTRRQLLEAVLDEIEDAIFILDERLEARFSNRAARSLFPGEHAGRSLIEICIDHRVVETVEMAMELSGKVQEHLARRPREPGDTRAERVYLVEAEPLAARGIGKGAWLLMRDITLQRETEQIRRDFVANASHELRTPLSIIGGYLEMLDEEAGSFDSATIARGVATMRKHAERVSRIVEDMLTISRLESGEAPLKVEPFDLGECLRGTLDHLQPLIEERHARVRIVLPEEEKGLCLLSGDRFYWDQIFFNLVENALKQNPEPGLKIAIAVVSEDSRYRIEIRDDGIGIPSADLPHIFKRFYRVQKDHSQIVKGTGLGLSIVKRAVEAHHGEISVRSQPGRETVFTISVPKPPVAALSGAGLP